MRKMKVLMLGNDPSVKGGITSVISQLLDHNWSQEGIDMQFIPTYIEANTISKILFFLKAYRKIRQEFKRNKPDIVHIHMSYKGSFTRKFAIHKLCTNYGIPDVIHLHGSEFKKWYDESDMKKKEQIRRLMRESSALVVLGEQWNRIVKEIEPNTNTIVVSNTVHIPQEVTSWKQPFQVLFLGVLIQRKGVEDLLKVIKLLKDSVDISHVHVVIAGSGEEEEKLKQQCESLKIDNLVEFVGWTTGQKKERLLKESQMLVLPSYNEGLPIAILEAISYGLPVVATDVGDIPSAVRNSINGFVFKPGDIGAFAEYLKEIIADRKLYENMSLNSRIIAENEFSDEKYFQKIKECYTDIGE